LKNISAIILAGGKSSRMGTDKGLLKINDKPMVEYVIDIAKEFSDDIYIITYNQKYNQFHLPLLSDIYPEKGPLGGIYTGLMNIKNSSAIVLSCDTPFIDKKTIETILESVQNYDIVYASENGKIHPLIGVYHKNCLPTFKKCLIENKLKMTLAFEELNTLELKIKPDNPKAFLNVNSKEDLAKI